MQIPPYIKPGSRIGIAATARKITPGEVEATINWLKSEGFEPVTGDHLFDQFNQYAGHDDNRRSDLQNFLDDETIDAIFIARGGYGTVRILDKLNLEKLTQHPKWIVGYSDVTALHSHINTVSGVATIHGTMPINIGQSSQQSAPENKEILLQALLGKEVSYQIGSHPLDKPGDFSGILTGGNLSVLYSINGSVSMPDTRGKVLFIEDIDEYLYHIDRMMMALDRAGHLSELSGLLVGGMTGMNDNAIPYGSTSEEIIRERIEKYDFPVKFGFPAGHDRLNLPIKFGVPCSIDWKGDGALFSQK